jgi:hypothetical protein
VMNKKAEERENNRDEYPYRCEHCHAGCKTLMGLMNRHAGSQKCVNNTGKMSSYTTPRKTVIDEEECIYINSNRCLLYAECCGVLWLCLLFCVRVCTWK